MESPAWLADEKAPDPQLSLEHQELEHALQHCLDNLPQEFRAIVVMVDVEGLDYLEVAQAAVLPWARSKAAWLVPAQAARLSAGLQGTFT